LLELENIPIGTVTIPLEPILCEDMKNGTAIGCIKCPKYAEGCNEFLAQYERKKDTNIDKISGGKVEERAMIRFEVAQQLVQIKEYQEAKNQKQRKILVRKLAPQITNRRLTEVEYDEVVEITRMLKEEMKKEQPEEEEEPDEQPPIEEIPEKEEKVVLPEPDEEPEEIYPDQDAMVEETKKITRKQVT